MGYEDLKYSLPLNKKYDYEQEKNIPEGLIGGRNHDILVAIIYSIE